jgi:hypothetical protein
MEAERKAWRENLYAETEAIKKKRHNGRHIAAGRRKKPKDLTRGDCGARGKLAASCRKVSLRATVAWRKRTIFRKIRTKEICGLRQEFGAAGIMVTLRAKLARWKGTFVRRNRSRATVTRGTRIARTVQEGKMDMGREDPGGRWPQYLMKGRTSTTNGMGVLDIRTVVTFEKQRNAEGGHIRVGQRGYSGCHDVEHQGMKREPHATVGRDRAREMEE